MVGDGPVWRPEIADAPGKSARIHPCDPDQSILREPSVERLGCAIICRSGSSGAQDETAGGGGRGFDVFPIRSDIADVWEGESNDLAGVRRVRQDFLITGDRRVE